MHRFTIIIKFTKVEEIDRLIGNGVGWLDFKTFRAVQPEVGANTYVYTTFNPDVVGEYQPVCLTEYILADGEHSDDNSFQRVLSAELPHLRSLD